MKGALRRAATLFALFLVAGLAGCNGNSISEGNDLICGEGDDCTNECTDAEEICDVECRGGSTCQAVCKPGKDCDFVCRANAECTFDCTQQSCQAVAEAGATCSCAGECVGTCAGGGGGGSGGGGGGGAGGGGGGGDGCIDACGAPSDPGYAACVVACSE